MEGVTSLEGDTGSSLAEAVKRFKAHGMTNRCGNCCERPSVTYILLKVPSLISDIFKSHKVSEGLTIRRVSGLASLVRSQNFEESLKSHGTFQYKFFLESWKSWVAKIPYLW